MAEELLDDSQVGSALEEMRGEGVPEAMRVGQEAAQRRGVERAATGGEEERVDGSPRELRPRLLEVQAQPIRRLLAQGDDALLAALAPHPHQLLLELYVGEREVDDFLSTEPGRISELEERSVPEPKRTALLEPREEAVGLVRARRVRKAPPSPAREREIGHAARSESGANQRADRGELARDRRLRELPRVSARAVGPELGGIAGKCSRVE